MSSEAKKKSQAAWYQKNKTRLRERDQERVRIERERRAAVTASLAKLHDKE
jgi:hypothetical protein